MTYQKIVEAPPLAISFSEITWPDALFLPWQTSVQSNFAASANDDDKTLPSTSQSVIENARKYVAKMPPAISGQNGHGQTLAVACALIKGFHFNVSDALPLLREYNMRCTPPWQEEDIERKLSEADRLRDEKPRGYLLLPERPYRSLGRSDSRPSIVLPGSGATISDCASELFKLIAPSHTVFNRGGKVVELVQETGGRYRLQIVTPSAFRSRAEKFGDLYAWRTGRDSKSVLKPTTMPEENSQGIA